MRWVVPKFDCSGEETKFICLIAVAFGNYSLLGNLTIFIGANRLPKLSPIAVYSDHLSTLKRLHSYEVYWFMKITCLHYFVKIVTSSSVMATINKNAEIDRPLIQDMNHSDEIRYKRLPFGILFMEKMGILSAVNPARKKKCMHFCIATHTS